MKKHHIFLLSLLSSASIYGNNPAKKDTLYTELKNDIVILSTTKETNSLKSLPAAVSIFSPKNLESLQVHTLKDLSGFVPNYFIADYGSKMTAPLYIRGIGARSGTQTVSLYIDNIPYFNTTSFDTELFDIQRVEVLRGTQGTLYGCNAMGGILNIYTFSPLNYEGTTVKIGGGNYGQLSANISHYQRINNKLGVSAAGYYKQNDGYFKNEYTGNNVDDLKNVGGRVKFEWNPSTKFMANYSVSFDYVDQGAFPYANIKTNIIDYNSEGYYKRKLFTNGLSLRYLGSGYEINSTTGYQYLNDEMNMDQDYTKLSMFQINQKQNQNSLSQEITVKSDNSSNYQWSNGIYGFYDYLHTIPPVYMMKDGIAMMQAGVDQAQAANPSKVPQITFNDAQLDLNGHYKRPTYGAALFHQSTFNNLMQTKGLSLTLGLRLDYEKTKLNYNANTTTNVTIKPPFSPMIITTALDTAIVGSASKDYLELLPKGVLKYEISPKSYLYLSASRGYKTGGHNIQVFADLLQDALNAKLSSRPGTGGSNAVSVNDRITYKPEYSWNYEIGGQIEIIENTLTSNFALYYMDVTDVQVTQFVKSLGGRMVTNAGHAESKGFEAGLKVRPCTGFYLYANYGFTDARFKDYSTEDKDGNEISYANNHIPFSPRFTFTLGANISYVFKNNLIFDRVTFDTNYNRIGRVYWNEANSLFEGYYNTIDARLAFDKNIFSLEFWGKNILNYHYNTFIFESSGNYFAQKGKPSRWGLSLKVKF